MQSQGAEKQVRMGTTHLGRVIVHPFAKAGDVCVCPYRSGFPIDGAHAGAARQ